MFQIRFQIAFSECSSKRYLETKALGCLNIFKSLIFWQLVIWGYESKPACGSRSRWFEATVPGFSEDVVLSCALLRFPTQQWDAQNWQDILMIFVETEISDDFSSCRSYTKNGTLVHHRTFPRGRSPSHLPKPTSNLAAPSSWWFLPCWGCISVQTNIFQIRWKCLMGQTRLASYVAGWLSRPAVLYTIGSLIAGSAKSIKKPVVLLAVGFFAPVWA